MTTKKTKPEPTAEPAAMFDLGTEEAPQAKTAADDQIHAVHCVVGSECNMTDGCRGKLRATRGTVIFKRESEGPQVQIYCPVCMKFAEGTRPLHGLTSGVGKLFDRSSGKVL